MPGNFWKLHINIYSNLGSSPNSAEAGEPLILMRTDVNCLLDFTVNLSHLSFSMPLPPTVGKHSERTEEMVQWLGTLAAFRGLVFLCQHLRGGSQASETQVLRDLGHTLTWYRDIHASKAPIHTK